MQDSFTFRQVAKELGVSRPTVYALVKHHEHELSSYIQENGKGHKTLAKDGVEILRRYVRESKADCKTDSKIDTEQTVDLHDNVVEILRHELDEKGRTIAALLEERARERERHDTIVMKLSQTIETTNAKLVLLEHTLAEKKAPREPIQSTAPECMAPQSPVVVPFKKKQAPEAKDPLEGRSLFTRVLAQLFFPHLLRRDAA